MDSDVDVPRDEVPTSPARFEVRVEGVDTYLDVEIPLGYGAVIGEALPAVYFKGNMLSRSEQEAWRDLVTHLTNEFKDSEYVPPSLNARPDRADRDTDTSCTS